MNVAFMPYPWGGAARHYDERGLAALVLMIATTNLFNRLNVSTGQHRRIMGLSWDFLASGKEGLRLAYVPGPGGAEILTTTELLRG
jgi:hypothetical protein